MDKNEMIQHLTKVLKTATVLQDEPMKKHTTFRIGGTADIYIKATEVEDIKKIVEFVKKNSIPLTVIGNGSNILVQDKGVRGVVLEVAIEKISFQEKEDGMLITAGAGAKLSGLSMMCMERALTGLEFAYGIPGTIGGAIRMNAGAHGGQMQDIVVSTTYIDFDGNIQTLTNEEQEFNYRESIFSKHHIGIILEAKLKLSYGEQKEIENKMKEYITYRKEKQPSYPSAGSTFKRGDGFITAKLIDECGLKGYEIGGAKISDLHAGFIINQKREATAKDILELIAYTKQKVYEKFGKEIELEIEIIGEE